MLFFLRQNNTADDGATVLAELFSRVCAKGWKCHAEQMLIKYYRRLTNKHRYDNTGIITITVFFPGVLFSCPSLFLLQTKRDPERAC